MLALILRMRWTLWLRGLRSGGSRRRLGPVFTVLVSLGIAAFVLQLGYALASGAQDNDPGRIRDLLVLPFIGVLVLGLFNGVSTALSELYVSSDLELLLTAPLGDLTLFALKLTDTLLRTLAAPLLGLAWLAGYGLALQLGPAFYIAALLAMLLFGLAVVLFDVVLVLLLTRIVPAKRLREGILLVGSMLGIVVWLLLRGSTARAGGNAGLLDQLHRLNSQPGLAPLGWAAHGLADAADGNFLRLLANLSLLIVFVLVLAGCCAALFAQVFLPAWAAAQESPGRRRRSRDAGRAQARAAGSSLVLAMALKDWRMAVRDVPYLSALLPSLLYAVLYPFVLLRLPTGRDLVGHWLSLVALPLTPLLATYSPALGAVGREGSAFDVLRSSAASPWRILAGKVFAVAAPVALVVAVIGGALAIVRQAPLSAIAVCVLGGLWLAAGCAAIGVGVGAFAPKFDLEQSRRRIAVTGPSCLLYAVVAALFIAGNVLLTMAIVAVALGRGGPLASVALVLMALALFAAGLLAVVVVLMIAQRRLAELLGPSEH